MAGVLEGIQQQIDQNTADIIKLRDQLKGIDQNTADISKLRDQLKSIDQNTADISKLRDQLKGLEHAGGVTKSTNALDTESNHCNEKPTRESGYVNWDESHDSIKNMRWMSSELFRMSTVGWANNYDRSAFRPVNEDRDCKIINENTRFPEDQKLYVNISDPKVQYVIKFYEFIFTPNKNFDNDYKLLTLIENHLHTRSSFEEKYNLMWVHPKV